MVIASMENLIKHRWNRCIWRALPDVEFGQNERECREWKKEKKQNSPIAFYVSVNGAKKVNCYISWMLEEVR